MDTDTIKKLIKIAEENLKVARAEFDRVNNTMGDYDDSNEWEWENLLEEAGHETYACEQVINFLKSNLETSKTK